MKRWVAIWLCVVLLAAVLPSGGAYAAAEGQELTLGQLKAKFPHGAYWNHTKGGSEDYTYTPCTHHVGNCTYNGSCGCNSYKNVAIQCMGFAYRLASLAYDCDPRAEWPTNRNKSALDTLKAGDIVRYRGNTHSIFVTAVEGETVTFADVNWDGHCGIRWNATVTKDTLRATFTYVKSAPYALAPEPALTVRYDGNGGTIDTTVVGHTYRVLSTNGINMRQDGGISHEKITALPCGTEFTVAVEDTKEADGYTWGKTTYGDKTGWVVISDFVEKIGAVCDSEWSLAEGILCRGGVPLSQTHILGAAMAAPVDPTETGLYRAGHRFAGWNTAADGSGVAVTAGLLPEALGADGDVVTLYALWEPILLGDADGDGRLSNRDLGLLQRYLNGWEVAVTEDADLNGDGTINNKDLGLLQRTLNDWNKEEEE